MIRARLRTVAGVEQAVHGQIEMPAAPRVGDGMALPRLDGDGSTSYLVAHVCWCPHEADYDIWVTLK